MKLRTKTLILTGIAMTVLFLIVGFISSTILMSGFNRIEDRETKEHIYTIRNVFDTERSSLLASTTSIAVRASTYAYFSDRSDSLDIDANFSEINSPLEFFDAIILADTSGQIIYERFYDRAKNRMIDFPSVYLTALQDELKRDKAGVQKSGFLMFDGKPGIIAICPVAKTGDSSNPVGSVMTLKILDKARLKRVAMIENVPLSVKAYNEPSLTEGFKNARSSFDHGNNYYTEPIDGNIIGVYSYLRDADGDPVLLIGVEIERDIAAQGRAVVSYVLTVLVIAYLVFTTVIMLSLSLGVLRRVGRMKNMISTIEQNPDVSLRIPVIGADELSETAISINKMLNALETARAEAISNWRLYEALAEASEDMIFEVDLKGNVTYMNEAAAISLGMSPADLLGKNVREFFPIESYKQFQGESRDRFLEKAQPWRFELEHKFRGQTRWIETWLVPIKGASGQVKSILGRSRDVTEQRKIQAEMAKSLEFYQRLFDEFPNPVWRTDAEGALIYVNTAGLVFTGHTIDEVRGESWMTMIHKDDQKKMHTRFDSSLKKQVAFAQEYRLRRFDGQFRWVLDRAQPFYDKEGRFGGFLGSILDITEKKLKVEELAYLATHDALTGLENRRVFEGALKRVIAKARRGTQSTILIADLDGLKGVNDTFGHLEGDNALVELGVLIKEEMRTSDISTRLGGDEFGIILEDTELKEAVVTAERLRESVEENLRIMGGIPLTISIGMTAIEIKDTVKIILSRADVALYEAKRRGRNVVIVYKEGMETSFSDVPVFKPR